MDILSLSKDSKRVTVTLDSDELVKLCNVLYKAEDKDKNVLYYKLYSDLMLARDLSQYGHLDEFCFKNIAQCRDEAKNLLNEK